MKHRLFKTKIITFASRTFLKTLVLCAITLTTTIGCNYQTSDHWQSMRDDFDETYAKHKDRETPIPQGAQPTVQNTPDLPELKAGEAYELSIEQAAVLMLRNNRDLRIQQLNPAMTGAYQQIERGVFDPEIFAEAQAQWERSLETARSTGAQFNVEGRDADIVGGIRQRLPSGTTIEATASEDRSISNRAPEQQRARLGLTITQSLLRGYGAAVNMVGIRQAELDNIASRYELRGYTEALLAETEIAYWQYVLATREIEIYEQSLEVAKKQRNETEQRIEVGVLAETEAAAARAEVARREQALIDARSEREARRLQLMRYINPHQAGQLDITLNPVTQPDIEPVAINNTAERLTLAERYRPDLNEARSRLEQNRLDTMVTRNGLLPRLELFIALGKTGFGDRFSETVGDLDSKTHDATVGLRFSQYLGNRTAEGQDLIARTARKQAAAAIENLQQLIHLDVQLALNEVERARQQIKATTITREYQQQTLEAEQERFKVGSSTSLLVSQAQRDLIASQIDEVESVINYRLALVRLYLAEGSLLERRGVTLQTTR